MPYVSYTSMKMIHDQKIEEALEDQRLYSGQETRKRGLLQTFGGFLARFTHFSVGKPKATFPGLIFHYFRKVPKPANLVALRQQCSDTLTRSGEAFDCRRLRSTQTQKDRLPNDSDRLVGPQ